jgi:hypothetical protein
MTPIEASLKLTRTPEIKSWPPSGSKPTSSAGARAHPGTRKVGTSAIPSGEAAWRMNITVVILRPAIGRTARAAARLSNRRSVSHAGRGSPDGSRAPRGRAVFTDGRPPMFRSMRHASLRRARSRRRSLWTSVHSHSRTSLRTRR